MSAFSLNDAARHVLGHFPAPLYTSKLISLGNQGGFSGARLWLLEGSLGSFCLRAWPAEGPSTTRLEHIHALMKQARQAGLDFVPAVLFTAVGTTWIECASRLWELTTWQPGRADYQEKPSSERLRAACTALARLHEVWHSCEQSSGPCPAIRRRLERIYEWEQQISRGWEPEFEKANDSIRPWTQRAWRVLRQCEKAIAPLLTPRMGSSVPLQPCLCDIWHDHVLFTDDRVTGIIDYGGVKTDHVSVDLARLLGSMVGDDPVRWAEGMHAYRAIRHLSREEEEMARVLDRSGVMVGVMTWLRWLYVEGRKFDDEQAVAKRLSALVQRMEGWEKQTAQLALGG